MRAFFWGRGPVIVHRRPRVVVVERPVFAEPAGHVVEPAGDTQSDTATACRTAWNGTPADTRNTQGGYDAFVRANPQCATPEIRAFLDGTDCNASKLPAAFRTEREKRQARESFPGCAAQIGAMPVGGTPAAETEEQRVARCSSLWFAMSGEARNSQAGADAYCREHRECCTPEQLARIDGGCTVTVPATFPSQIAKDDWIAANRACAARAVASTVVAPSGGCTTRMPASFASQSEKNAFMAAHLDCAAQIAGVPVIVAGACSTAVPAQFASQTEKDTFIANNPGCADQARAKEVVAMVACTMTLPASYADEAARTAAATANPACATRINAVTLAPDNTKYYVVGGAVAGVAVLSTIAYFALRETPEPQVVYQPMPAPPPPPMPAALPAPAPAAPATVAAASERWARRYRR